MLLKFDTAACTGMTVRRATLYLPRTEQCAPAVIAPSTVSTDWEEGDGTGNPDAREYTPKGASALYASQPDTTWASPGSNLKWVIFGEGGSTYGARSTGLAAEGKTEYVAVDMPLDVVHGLLVTGD